MELNNKPLIYNYPQEVQNLYQLLMNSKVEFSKKLLPADQARLTILYDRLASAWSLNNTEQLSKSLDMNFQELEQLQKEINSDWSNYEKSIEEEQKQNVKIRLNQLEQKKENLPSLLNEVKETLQRDIESTKEGCNNTLTVWKNDIYLREDLLKTEEEALELKHIELTSLLDISKEMEQDKVNFEMLQEDYKMKLIQLNENRKVFEQNIINLKEVNNQDIQKLAEQLEHELIPYQLNFEERKKELKKIFENKKKELEEELSLKRKVLYQNKIATEEQLLITLKEKILKEATCPTELKNYLKSGEFSSIGKKNIALTNDIKSLSNVFEKEITRNGIDKKWFWENFDSDYGGI